MMPTIQRFRWIVLALAVFCFQESASAQEALLIQDTLPWDFTAWQSELANTGVPYAQIDSASVATTPLDQYHMVITSSVQGNTSYTTLNGLVTEFEDYVEQGGILIWSGCTRGDEFPYPIALFGGENNTGGNANNNVEDPTHPLLANVTDPIYGQSANHNYWTDLPVDAEVLVTHPENFNPILYLLYRGSGVLIATGQTWEHGWGNGQDAGTVLANAVNWGWALEICEESDLDGDGYTECDGDCNDNDPSLTPADMDMDGFSSCDGDCDDSRSDVYHGCVEICDEVDNNCDGIVDEGFDYDHDGHTTCGMEPDCNDYDNSVYPGATEVPYDAIDQDCDGFDLTDIDMDGFDGIEVGGTDCDDLNAAIYPGAEENCANGIDDNCDGAPDEHDSDCAVGDDSANPEAEHSQGILCQCDAAGRSRAPVFLIGMLWLALLRLTTNQARRRWPSRPSNRSNPRDP